MTIVPAVAISWPCFAQRHDRCVHNEHLATRDRRARQAEPATALRPPACRDEPPAQPRRTPGRTHRPRDSRRDGSRDAIQLLERSIPPNDAIVEVENEQSVVERLEDVFVEGTHPIDFDRLQVQLTIESRVLERCRDLPRDCGEQAISSLLSGSPVSFRPTARTAMVPSFATHGTK